MDTSSIPQEIIESNSVDIPPQKKKNNLLLLIIPVFITLVILLTISGKSYFSRSKPVVEPTSLPNQEEEVLTDIPSDPIEEREFRSIDDLFEKVAIKYPGFGGMFVDEQKDVVYVYLKGGELDAVVTEIKTVFGRDLPKNAIALVRDLRLLGA